MQKHEMEEDDFEERLRQLEEIDRVLVQTLHRFRTMCTVQEA
jgi:hypothetical protein